MNLKTYKTEATMIDFKKMDDKDFVFINKKLNEKEFSDFLKELRKKSPAKYGLNCRDNILGCEKYI
jgi:hypothetical protein